MKKCSTCGQEKPATEFNKKSGTSDGLQRVCRECNRVHCRRYYEKSGDHQRERVKERKRCLVVQYHAYKKTLSCAACGEDHSCCLEFHHLDGDDKDMNVSMMAAQGYAISRVMKEIEKCVVLCANCHRKVHAGVITGIV